MGWIRKLHPILALFGVVFTAALKWAFDSILWDAFLQFLDKKFGLREAELITSISSIALPLLIAGGAGYGIFWFGKEHGRKRHAALVECEEKPDWQPIKMAMDWAVQSDPGLSWNDPFKVRDAIRQAAAAGNLRVRGFRELQRHYPGERFDVVRTEIPAAYWEHYTFDLTVVMDPTASNDRPDTESVQLRPPSTIFYKGVQTDMKQVKKLWS